MELWDMTARMLSSLALVVALMLVVAAVAKRLLGSRFPMPTGVPLVQVVGSSYLGPRKTVSLISVAGELLIVGTTQNDIVPLGRLSDAEHIKRALAHTPLRPPLTDASLWSQVWQGLSRRPNAPASRPSSSANDDATHHKGDHASS